MKTKIIHFGETADNKAIYDMYKFNRRTNNGELQKMKAFIQNAIENELTPKQRQCLTEHFINGKKQKEIAAELKLSASTVCRHINAAKKKLQHIARYYKCSNAS